MRTIPAELLNRVKRKWQVTAENANPGMKAYLSRGLINELFQVYTIQAGENLEAVDVAVKRVSALGIPAEVFALCLDNGVASVKTKPLPYDELIPWVLEFMVASGVSDAAIEFDGYWEYSFDELRYNFITVGDPWIFYVQSGTLYAQQGQDSSLILATDVSKVAAIRGWVPANGDTNKDQGLIVAYVKSDGHVYYRNYCIQEGGGQSWEEETQIVAFTGTAASVALFRTNDFRIGVLCENTDESLYYTVTTRNWGGMSFPAELFSIDASLVSIGVVAYEVQTYGYSAVDETLQMAVTGTQAIVNIYSSTPESAQVYLTGGTVVDDRTFTLEFNCPVWAWDTEKALSSVSLYPIIAVNIDGATVTYTSAIDIDTDGFNVTLAGGIFIGVVSQGRQLIYGGGSTNVMGEIQPHIATLTMDVVSVEKNATAYETVLYPYTALPTHTLTMGLSYDAASFALTETGTDPI